MTYVSYTGHEVLTFQDYTDLETGRTLTAEPGHSYDVAPASGRLAEDFPAGWFVPASDEEIAARQAAAEAERLAAENAAAEGGEGAAPDGTEHEGGEPQQF